MARRDSLISPVFIALVLLTLLSGGNQYAVVGRALVLRLMSSPRRNTGRTHKPSKRDSSGELSNTVLFKLYTSRMDSENVMRHGPCFMTRCFANKSKHSP